MNSSDECHTDDLEEIKLQNDSIPVYHSISSGVKIYDIHSENSSESKAMEDFEATYNDVAMEDTMDTTLTLATSTEISYCEIDAIALLSDEDNIRNDIDATGAVSTSDTCVKPHNHATGAKKHILFLGYDENQIKREKALRKMGLTEENVDEAKYCNTLFTFVYEHILYSI